MRMLAPAQNTRSLPDLSTTTFTSGMLEAQPLHGVGELDVDAQVVGVELELIALEQAGVLVDVHDQLGDVAVEFQLPVAVARGLGLEIDAFGHDGATPNRLRSILSDPRLATLRPAA